jgi:pilus assembly protein Flp/PilA
MGDEPRKPHTVGMSPIRLFRHTVSFAIARMNLRSERGASAVEYGIMVMLIASVIIVAVLMLGSQTSTGFSCTGEMVRTKAAVAGCG